MEHLLKISNALSIFSPKLSGMIVTMEKDVVVVVERGAYEHDDDYYHTTVAPVIIDGHSTAPDDEYDDYERTTTSTTTTTTSTTTTTTATTTPTTNAPAQETTTTEHNHHGNENNNNNQETTENPCPTLAPTPRIPPSVTKIVQLIANKYCQYRDPGLYQLPSICDVFVSCSTAREARPIVCPIGTSFNPRILVCDHEYNYECSRGNVESKFN